MDRAKYGQRLARAACQCQCVNAMKIPAIWAAVVAAAPSLFTAVLVQLSKCLAEFTLNIINILQFYNTI